MDKSFKAAVAFYKASGQAEPPAGRDEAVQEVRVHFRHCAGSITSLKYYLIALDDSDAQPRQSGLVTELKKYSLFPLITLPCTLCLF